MAGRDMEKHMLDLFLLVTLMGSLVALVAQVLDESGERIGA